MIELPKPFNTTSVTAFPGLPFEGFNKIASSLAGPNAKSLEEKKEEEAAAQAADLSAAEAERAKRQDEEDARAASALKEAREYEEARLKEAREYQELREQLALLKNKEALAEQRQYDAYLLEQSKLYQSQLQNLLMSREDTAISRAAYDARRAGLDPTSSIRGSSSSTVAYAPIPKSSTLPDVQAGQSPTSRTIEGDLTRKLIPLQNQMLSDSGLNISDVIRLLSSLGTIVGRILI